MNEPRDGRQTPIYGLVSFVCLGALILLLPLSGCERAPATGYKDGTTPSAAIDRLVDLMRQRLLVMHDVARWKWNARVPIADPGREKSIVDAIVVRGAEHGLNPGFARSFFLAQFDAAKRLQECDFERWEAEHQTPFGDVPDLATQLRPKIDNFNRELLDVLAVVGPLLSNPEVRNRLRERAAAVLNENSITEGIWEVAICPLVAPRP